MSNTLSLLKAKMISGLVALILTLNLFPFTAIGQVVLPERYRPLQAPILKEKGKNFDVESLSYIIQLISSTLLYAAGAIAVFLLVFNGFRYVAAAGRSDAVDAAKKSILWTIAGLAMIIFAIVIVENVITWIFKLQQT